MHVWSSLAVVCEPRRPGLVGPPGFHTTAREPKRAHFRAPAFENTTKIQREDTQRDTERAKRWREREEKERNFGRSSGRWSREVRTSSNHNNHNHNNAKPRTWGREGPAPSPKQGLGFVFLGVGHNKTTTKIGQNTKTLKLAKIGLAKVGLAKVGHDRVARFCVLLPSDVSTLLGCVRVVNSDVGREVYGHVAQLLAFCHILHPGDHFIAANQTLRRNMHAIRPQVQAVWLGGYVLCFCFRPQPELNRTPNPPRKPLSAGQLSTGQPSAGPPSAGQPFAGPPKISFFFSLLPPQFSFFFLSLGVLSWPPGLHTTAENSKRAHFRPRRWKKERILRRDREKKARNFGPPPLGGLHLWGPHLLCPRIQHLKIGRSRCWPKSMLAEIDIGRSRSPPEVGPCQKHPLSLFLFGQANWKNSQT